LQEMPVQESLEVSEGFSPLAPLATPEDPFVCSAAVLAVWLVEVIRVEAAPELVVAAEDSLLSVVVVVAAPVGEVVPPVVSVKMDSIELARPVTLSKSFPPIVATVTSPFGFVKVMVAVPEGRGPAITTGARRLQIVVG